MPKSSVPRGLSASLIARLSLAALLASGPVRAAPAAADQLTRLDGQVVELEQRLVRLESNYTQRRGLIGAEEAQTRYREAVFAYLIGQYDRAADAFFALVESEALSDTSLVADSEWYLGECLFEMANYATSVEAFEDIVRAGPTHPFFADAVRRQLEIYGITGDTERFYELYNRYIVTGKVLATDVVKYTVAKSFYRQGENARATALLDEFTRGMYFTRARYLLGTIRAVDGDLEGAISQFERVLEIEPTTEVDREIHDLGLLALGRLYYELGDYEKATAFYQQIDPLSVYFADKLYEQVWTFIKQERWSPARDQIDIFLVGFPDHRYSVQLKLIQAHLHMKDHAYDDARLIYESVVEEYSPIRDSIARIESERETAADYFNRIAMSQDFEETGVLPSYALEMLVSDELVGRSVSLQRELNRQDGELLVARGIIEEIESIVMGGAESVGTFNRGRAQLRMVRDDGLRVQGALIELQLAELSSVLGEAEIASARARWEAVRARAAALQDRESSGSDRVQVYDAQVREVQGLASRLAGVNKDLEAELKATRRVLSDNEAGLSSTEQLQVAAQLDALELELGVVGRELDRAQSPATRSRVMASLVRRNGASEQDRAWTSISDEYDSIQERLTSLRSRDTSAEAREIFSRSDTLWSRVDALGARSDATMARLSEGERRELDMLKRRLAVETTQVSRSTSDLGETRRDSDVLAADVTRHGFEMLDASFADTILQADMGIVDVYWLRKTEVSDEITRLATERSSRLAELDARFGLVRQKLEE